MTLAIGSVVRASMSFSAPAASIAQMVFWFKLSTADVAFSDVIADVAAYFANNHLNEWDDIAADVAEAFLVEADEMNLDGTVKNQIGSNEISRFGLDAGHLLPAGVAAYIQVDSEANKAKGRKYLPFLTENQSTDGLWNAATLAKLAAFLLDYLGVVGVTGGGLLLPGVLSRPLAAFQLFTGSGYTTDTPAYQRRRKPNVGS